MPEAIRACYEIIPQHPARRNGEKVNGHRDGMFLIEEIIRVSCMGKLGLKRLLNWYRDEIAFNANMPAMGLQAYLDYLKQSMKEFPTVAKHLKAVSEATPGSTASLKLYQLAVRTSEPLAHAVLQQLPEIEKYLGKGDRTVLQHSIHTLLRSASRMLARQAETGDRLQNVAVQLKPHSVFAQSPQGTRLVHYVMNKVLPEMDDHERQKVETTFAAITTLFAGK